MTSFIDTVADAVWAPPLVILCLFAGLFFTIRTRLVQVRLLPAMVRQILQGERSAAGVSSFQALTMSLAGRVGTGNIAGVATAIAFGGPGAVFWMWVVAFLGASTAFVESTLGQIYKERDGGGEYRGGPAYYIEKVTAHSRHRWARTPGRVYAMVFAAVTVVAMGVLLPGVQANGISTAMSHAWGVQTWAVAIGIVIALSFIVVGGVKRIANFTQIVVPFMAVVYILLAIAVVVINADQIPQVIGMIFSSAFGAHAVFGSIIGLAVEWGVKRGIYSNEAGQGTGPHPAAAAEVSHPAKQGLVQAFSVYVDTLFVCSATAFLILSTGMYKIFPDAREKSAPIAVGNPTVASTDVEVGPSFAQNAFDTMWSGAGASFIAISLAFFAFTTIVAYYYMAETNLTYLLRGRRGRAALPVAIRLLQLVILLASSFGAVREAKEAWTLGDIGVGAMAWLNIVAILLIQGPAFAALRDFERQRTAGLDPQFDPGALNITGADFWLERAATQRRTTSSAASPDGPSS